MACVNISALRMLSLNFQDAVWIPEWKQTGKVHDLMWIKCLNQSDVSTV